MPNTTLNSIQTHLSSLDNTWNKVIKDEKGVKPGLPHDPNIVRVNRGDYYWNMVRFQNKYAYSKSMRLCNRVPIQNADGIKDVIITQKGQNSPQYGNLLTCKSMWCPCCSNYHKKPMRTKARQGIANSLKAGYTVKMVTLTVPRNHGNNDFSMKFDAMNKTFKELIGRLRMKCKRKGVRLYSLKGLDVTVDTERYDPLHLHIHALIITDRKIDDFEDWLWRTYKRLQNKRGIHVDRRAFDVSDILKDKEITDYIVKTLGTIEQEITSKNKDGRDGKSKGWFKFVSSVSENPTKRDIAIYSEFLRCSAGRRCFDFSRNWNELILMDFKEIEDGFEEYEDKEDEKFYVWRLDSQLWEAIKALRVELDVLRVIERRKLSAIDRKRWCLLEFLINNDTYELFGEHKKNFYCKGLIELLQSQEPT